MIRDKNDSLLDIFTFDFMTLPTQYINHPNN